MTGLVILLYATAVLAFIDAVRRPTSEWVEADRNKAFWLVMLVILNVLGALMYTLFILPRFPRGQSQVENAFLKGSVVDHNDGKE